MTSICSETLDAIAHGRRLSSLERRHSKSCARCRRAEEIPQRVSEASRALSSIEPHIGFAARAITVARGRAKRRRATFAAATFAAAAAVAILVFAAWPERQRDRQIAEPAPDTRSEDGQWILTQPAQHFDPARLLEHDDALALSPKQLEALRDLVADLQKDVVGLTAKLQMEEIDLSRELRRENPSRKKIAQYIRRIGRLTADLRKTQTLAWLDARDLLSSDQRSTASKTFGGEQPTAPALRHSLRRDSDRIAELERNLETERTARVELERKLAATAQKRKLRPYESLDDSPAESSMGTLMINTKPYSHVYIDGRRVGVTPIRKEVRAGRHTVKLSTDRGTKSFRVNVRAGKVLRLIKTFDAPDEEIE